MRRPWRCGGDNRQLRYSTQINDPSFSIDAAQIYLVQLLSSWKTVSNAA